MKVQESFESSTKSTLKTYNFHASQSNDRVVYREPFEYLSLF